MARPEAAIKAWDYALAIAPGDIEKQGVLIHLARVKLQLGELDEAQQHLDQVLLPMYQELKDRVGRNLSRRRQDLLPDADLR
jgi:tetratricopeptide (TPR) repeat protein